MWRNGTQSISKSWRNICKTTRKVSNLVLNLALLYHSSLIIVFFCSSTIQHKLLPFLYKEFTMPIAMWTTGKWSGQQAVYLWLTENFTAAQPLSHPPLHQYTYMHNMSRHVRDCRSLMSPRCWHQDTTSAVDSSSYPRRPRLSGGCSACMEQSATRDSGLLLTFDILETNLTFFISHTADVAPSTSMVSRRLHWAVQQFKNF